MISENVVASIELVLNGRVNKISVIITMKVIIISHYQRDQHTVSLGLEMKKWRLHSLKVGSTNNCCCSRSSNEDRRLKTSTRDAFPLQSASVQ